MDRILALAGELEGGRMRLSAFHMQHRLLGFTALKQRIYTNYLLAALQEAFKLVGSSNFLGKPRIAQEVLLMKMSDPFNDAHWLTAKLVSRSLTSQTWGIQQMHAGGSMQLHDRDLACRGQFDSQVLIVQLVVLLRTH